MTTKKRRGKGRKKRSGKGRFRSIFERKIADTLRNKGVAYDYERERFAWFSPSNLTLLCPSCGEISGMVKRHYTPDFFIRGTGVVIEAKGRLTAADRKKLVAVRDRYPDLDLRLLFQDDGFLTTAANRVAKSRVRNSEWAEGVGIPHAICGRDGRNIPEAWIK
jgi:hypothetical protein